jgi:hypothetical protein
MENVINKEIKDLMGDILEYNITTIPFLEIDNRIFDMYGHKKVKTPIMNHKKGKFKKMRIAYTGVGCYFYIDLWGDIENKTKLLENDINGCDYEFNLRIRFNCYNCLYSKWVESYEFKFPSQQYILKIKINSNILMDLSKKYNDDQICEFMLDLKNFLFLNIEYDSNQGDNSNEYKERLDDFMEDFNQYVKSNVTIDDILNNRITKDLFINI